MNIPDRFFLPASERRLRSLLILFVTLLLSSAAAFGQALPPIELRLETGVAGNYLEWTDGGNDGATTFIRYQIGRSLVSGGPYTNATFYTTEQNYTDTTAVPGTTYYYAVCDENSGGTSAWSTEVTRFWPLDGATTDVQTYRTEFSVWARWPIYPGELVKTFVGLSTIPGKDNVVPFKDVGHATEYTFTGLNLEVGKTYYVTVKVQDSAGYLGAYGTSVCSSNGFTVDTTPTFVDDTASSMFNNATARVMTQINANDVTAVNFADGAIRRYRAPVTVTEPGIESRLNAPMEITVGGTGFPTTLAAAQQQVRVADEWGNEVPCRVTSNGSNLITQDIYNAGVESVPIVQGYMNPTSTAVKNAAQLTLTATTNGAESTFVTDTPVDLTDWDEVVIDWTNTGANNNGNESWLTVSSNKMGAHTIADASVRRTRTFAATTTTLSVSGLSGLYYIRVHAYRASANSTVNVTRIYRRKTVYQSAMTLIGNLPKSQSRDYWVFWGGGTVAPAAFANSTNGTSQNSWTQYYSRKLLPPGVENYPLSVFTKLAVTGDDTGTTITLPWTFPFFDITRTTFYYSTNSHLSGATFNTWTNAWGTFTGNNAPNGMIAPMWCDTMTGNATPQDAGLYTYRADAGNANDRLICYSRNNRYNRAYDIYIHQAVLYARGDIALRYEYLSPGALFDDGLGTDNGLNDTIHHTSGITRMNGSNYLWSTPLTVGIGKAPTSFFQYKNAVDFTTGTPEDAGTGWGFAGHFDSTVFDSRSGTPNWDRLLYDITAGGGRFSFYTRSGSTPVPDQTWSAWQALALNVNTDNVSPGTPIPSPDSRFLQYRCVFQKAAAGNTPTLNKVSISCGSLKIERVYANTPDGVSQGQTGIPVSVRIKNDTPVAISLSDLKLSFSLGSYTQVLSSPILSGSIPSGVASDATFTVDIWPDSPVGTATIQALATGTGGGFTYADLDADQPHVWRVRSKAALQITAVDTTPVFVNKGQDVKIRMMISNTGESGFTFTGATMTFTLGTYTRILESPSPGYCLDGLSSMIATFLITIRPESPSGVAIIDGTASGTNVFSGEIIGDAHSDILDSWTIQNPSEFILESVIASSLVYRGQVNIPVTLRVRNMGEAMARWETSALLPYFTLGNYDAVYPRNLPKPGSAIELYGGLATSAIYGVDINPLSVTGSSSVDARVAGTDSNTNDPIDDEYALYPATWTIVAEKIKTYRDPACQYVWNSFNRPEGAATRIVYAKAESLAPWKEFVIRWYDPNGIEVASTAPPLTSDASGTITHQYVLTKDSLYGIWAVRVTNPLNTITSCENNFEVVTPASLTVALSMPPKVSVGQSFNASMTFFDIGGADITSAEPYPPTTGGTGGATFVGGHSPLTHNISSGNAATFSWLLTANAAGTFIATASGFGYDANSEARLTSASSTCICLIQTPPALTITAVKEAYTDVYRNQTGLVVELGVKNTGQADAVIEAASLSFNLGTHTQSLGSTLPFTLSGGSAATFTFTVAVDADSPVGNVTITGSYLAHDANHPTVKYAVSGGPSGAWRINAVRGICSANATYNPEQYAFTKGQTVYARFVNLPLNTAYCIRFYNIDTGGAAVKNSPPLNSGGFGVCDDLWELKPALGTTLARKWRVSIDTGTPTAVGTIIGVQYFEVQDPPQMTAALTLSPTTTDIFVGDTVTATLIASNIVATGATIAPAVPSDLVKTTGSLGDVAWLSGPTPASASIAGGNTTAFVWTFQATANTGTGVGSFSMTASLSASVAGYDVNTGLATSSNKSVSNSIKIYQRSISIASSALLFGSRNPGETAGPLTFRVNSTGNYELSAVKWNKTDLNGPDTFSKAYLDFSPEPLGKIAASAFKLASATLPIPYMQTAGLYIATMSVYEDLNANSNQDFNEPNALFNVQVTIKAVQLIVVTDPVIDLGGLERNQIITPALCHSFNGGNIPLDRLKFVPVTGSATFLVTGPNPGHLDIGAAHIASVSGVVPPAANFGTYIATWSLFEDIDDDGSIDPGEASASFQIRLKIGSRSFNCTPAVLDAGNATPTTIVSNLKEGIVNTGTLPLTRIRAVIHSLDDGLGHIIASDSIVFTPPGTINPGQTATGVIALYVPGGTFANTYVGTHWVFEDSNFNDKWDTGEASASFVLKVTVLPYRGVQVLTPTVELGDLARNNTRTVSFLCKNIGNIPLDKLRWRKEDLKDGVNILGAANYSFTPIVPDPFTAGVGTFSRDITITVPALQAYGDYLASMTWLFDDLDLNTSIGAGESKSPFFIHCRVGDILFDIIESSVTAVGDPSATTSPLIRLNVKNTGTLAISNLKATATMPLTGPQTIPATASIFQPSTIGYLPINQSNYTDWSVAIPPGTPAGNYTNGEVTIWNDSDGNGLIGVGEGIATAVLNLTVNAKKALSVQLVTPDLGYGAANTTVVGTATVTNTGNIPLLPLSVVTALLQNPSGDTIPAAQITFAPIGALAVGASASVSVSVTIPNLTPAGNYAGNQRFYEDIDAPLGSYQPSEVSALLNLKLSVGVKSLSVTPLVDFGTQNPGVTCGTLPPFVASNTSQIKLQRMAWKPTNMMSGTDIIASSALTFAPSSPFDLLVGIPQNCTGLLSIGPFTPPGTYEGTHTLWGDNNGNGAIDSNEASATFQTRVVVKQVNSLDILDSTIAFGDIPRGGHVAKEIGFRNVGNASLTNFVWTFQDLSTSLAEVIPSADLTYQTSVPAIVPPGDYGSITVDIHVSDGNQPLGDYTGIGQTLSGTGGANDICTFTCRVVTGGISGLASGSVYQTIASTTQLDGVGIPIEPLPPTRFILSAFVCPGTGTAAIGFFQTASPTKAMKDLNYVAIDPRGNLTASTSFDVGVTESYTTPGRVPGEEFTWFRIYISFDMSIDQTTTEGFHVLLQNRSPDTASHSVWFDGVQFEKALYTDQKRPTKFAPQRKLVTPNQSLDLEGKMPYIEW
ncbi:MAG TPA: hypothetical protein VIV61_06220 [Candidatus Ozemobacteraceae bacterium]